MLGKLTRCPHSRTRLTTDWGADTGSFGVNCYYYLYHRKFWFPHMLALCTRVSSFAHVQAAGCLGPRPAEPSHPGGARPKQVCASRRALQLAGRGSVAEPWTTLPTMRRAPPSQPVGGGRLGSWLL